MTAKLRHALGTVVSTIVLIAIFGLAGTLLLPAAAGYQRYVIRTGSMTGTLDPGSLVYDQVVPVADLKQGDIITYLPPGVEHSALKLVTHRIYSIRREHGQTIIRTKGDANDAPDTWQFVPAQPKIARVAAHIPYVGYAYAQLNSRRGRLLVFAIPGILIALSVLAGLWREAGDEARRLRAQQPTADGLLEGAS